MANKPYVVVEWNDTETDAKGWMCAYNFVGHYCGGGTRMHPTVTKEEVIRLATTMGYKYKACGMGFRVAVFRTVYGKDVYIAGLESLSEIGNSKTFNRIAIRIADK